MLYKTKGIILHFIKYKEHSIIVRIYTEKLGFQSYVVNSIRSIKNKQNKIALYQPFNLVDLVVYYKSNKAINRISEINIDYIYKNIESRKKLIIIFLLEIFNKILIKETANPIFFNFIRKSCIIFDSMSCQYENFHIQFMLKMSKYLGIAIYPCQSLSIFLEDDKENHDQLYNTIDMLVKMNYTQHIAISNKMRRKILNMLTNFYKFHIENFNVIHSLSVLQDLQ